MGQVEDKQKEALTIVEGLRNMDWSDFDKNCIGSWTIEDLEEAIKSFLESKKDDTDHRIKMFDRLLHSKFVLRVRIDGVGSFQPEKIGFWKAIDDDFGPKGMPRILPGFIAPFGEVPDHKISIIKGQIVISKFIKDRIPNPGWWESEKAIEFSEIKEMQLEKASTGWCYLRIKLEP
jgi:hypothetical protein